MTEIELRSRVHEFYAAIASRDAVRIAPFLDDDIDFMVYGPAEVLPFFGHRRGKEAVLRMYRDMPKYLAYTSYAREGLLVDGNETAAFIRATARLLESGRTISWHMAHFMIFRNGKVVNARVLYDSFDIVEQALGHEIDLQIER